MRSKKKKIQKLIAMGIFLFFASLILQSVGWLQKEWDIYDFATIVYQMNTPLKGTNSEVILSYCRSCIPGIILWTVGVPFLYYFIADIAEKMQFGFSVRLFSFQGKIKLYIKRKYRVWIGKIICIGVILIFGINICIKIVELDIPKYVKDTSSTTQIFEEKYIDPADAEIEFPVEKRNLILIYLESMETTYASVEEGGGKQINYIPELTQLAKENINISNGEKLGGAAMCTGTTWTMGALLASSAGVPFKSMIDGNAAGNYREFLPGITTLGDILEKEGYDNYFLCGSEGEFGGRAVFYETHGNYSMHDYEYAKEKGYIPQDYNEFWGYEDEVLFEIAKEELTQLGNSEKGQPFNYTMITVDTHHPDGYICGLCDNVYEGKYANAIACSSKQTVNFVDWITQQSWYEDTTVILIGDHLSMAADFWSDIGNYKRRTYNCFLNLPESVNVQNITNRGFYTTDFFPTILTALGAEIEGERLGLGTNLFSDKATLVEEMGNEFSGEISKYSEYYVEQFEKGNREVK